MNKTELMTKLSRTVNKAGFALKKHSPEILLGAGIIGGVASAIMACKATTKASAVLEKAKNQVEAIHTVANDPELATEYSPEDKKKDLAIVYAQTGLDFAKLYGPAILLGAASITCILSSHNIIHKRNVALAAAYMTEHTNFKDYRNRLIDRFGKELDRELKYNIKTKEVDEVIQNEDGSETIVTKTVEVASPNLGSDYARFFDETCPYWDKDPEYNLMFVRRQQDYANDLLKQQGYLLLNDVYKMLGMQATKAGMVVGWIYNSEDGDGYIDFGIYDVHDERKRAFVNGYERSILLDFNVDGNIYELMK